MSMVNPADIPFPGYIWDFLESSEGEFLREDVKAWTLWRGGSFNDMSVLRPAFATQFRNYAEFRSLVDFRLRKSINYTRAEKIMPAWPRAVELNIWAEYIGPRFRIQHGHSTWVMGRLGSDCLVRHNTTIGMHPVSGAPTIGNRVEIGTGAVVFGNITVGDNVKIGPNAVVNCDVPPNSRVFAPRPVIVPMKAG